MIFVDPIKKFNDEHVDLARIQIDNSLALGWKIEDILIVTNFEYEYRGVEAFIVGDDCYYGKNNFYMSTKIPVIIRLFEMGKIKEGEIYWFHDFDAFELSPLKEEDLGLDGYDAGFTSHGWKKLWNAGSFFFKTGSKDIFEQILHQMDSLNIDEQDALTYIWDKDVKGINKRYKLLNNTYNIGIYKTQYLINQADLPIRVAHFHPHKKRHLEIFRDVLPERLMIIFNSYGIS